MDKVTIEQKAKRYDEILARANGANLPYYKEDIMTKVREFAEYLLPELKESEDEKIRKKVIDVLKLNIRGAESQMQASRGVDRTFEVHACNKAIAWLEKKDTPAKLSEEEQNRFAKGVLTSCALSFIDYLDAHKYEGKMCVSNGECEDIENAFHNAMWDRLHRYYCKYIEKQGGQNSVWSEEDDRMMNDTLAVVDWYAGTHRKISVKVSNWLKSIKFRLLSPSMREFDKEEGSIIDHLIAICDDAMCYDTFAGCSKKDIEKYKSFLIYLKFGINPQPQTTWKPSDEQMKVLDAAVMHSHLTTAEYDELVKLREQLKKLREE